MRVTIVGEVVVDRFFQADGSVLDVAGGSAANTAIALQRSGIDTALRARFSTDAAGRFLRKHNEAESLDLGAAPDVDEPASVVEVRLAADGQPSYRFRLAGAADWQWTAAELATPLPAETALVHVGSLAAVLEPGATQLRAWLSALRPRPLVSFDPNARPAAAASEAEAQAMRDAVDAWIDLVDFVKVSDEDLRWLAPEVPEHEQAAAWSRRTGFVVMTQGGDGASAFVDGECRLSVPVGDVAVVDTVGAGDTFMAWLIRGVVRDGRSISALAQDTKALEAIVTAASRAASVNCSRRGCNPPFANEV